MNGYKVSFCPKDVQERSYWEIMKIHAKGLTYLKSVINEHNYTTQTLKQIASSGKLIRYRRICRRC